MTYWRTYIAKLTLLTALIGSIASVGAEEVHYDGCAYEDCRIAPTITPQQAIATATVVATVVVLLHTTKHDYAHLHAH